MCCAVSRLHAPSSPCRRSEPIGLPQGSRRHRCSQQGETAIDLWKSDRFARTKITAPRSPRSKPVGVHHRVPLKFFRAGAPLTLEIIHKIGEAWKIPADLLVRPYKIELAA